MSCTQKILSKNYFIVIKILQCGNILRDPIFQFPHRNTLVVQWLGLCTSTAGDTGSIPGPGTKIPHASSTAKKRKRRKNFLRSFFKEENQSNMVFLLLHYYYLFTQMGVSYGQRPYGDILKIQSSFYLSVVKEYDNLLVYNLYLFIYFWLRGMRDLICIYTHTHMHTYM